LVQEQVGRATNALAWMLSTPPQWWVGVATEYQRDRWLVPTVRGDAVECYAITEEHAGSDVAQLEATARRTREGYLLDGVKWHVTSYNEATYAFFQAVLTEGPHAGSHAMFVVDLPSEGVRVVRVPAYSHTIVHHHPIVAFEAVEVPRTHLVGDEGNGMEYAHEWFRFERFMVAARCVGAAERLIDEAARFAAERTVSDGPLIGHQLIQAMLADSLTELFAARSLLYESARGVDENRDRKVQHAQASMAKLYASEMANRVADRAVQIFGGRGYMRENVAERFYRELRVERIWEGTSEIQRLIVASQLAKRGLRALA
ncbi:MAG TPA: acyl-CoA dehydrogenase, partial [Acidimicrobiales bacterium]|nr:acyl-CoA dehydrogenase [Acidimicrobiales bacterium]